MRKKIKIISISAKIRLIRVISVLLFLVAVAGCGKNYSPEQKAYISKIEEQRAEKNEWMKNNPNSPFNFKGKVEFHELKYFDVDPDFIFKSKLYEYDSKDTVIIFGTKGEERKTVKFGYVKFVYEGNEYTINVYQGSARSGEVYYSIWFTDHTTNKESYGVGRYIDFEKQIDPDHIYEIDFNLAYNPYCAYSPDYSCAIPTKDDFLDVAVRAGEKKFHD
jgi:uncharacterized protein (DUF1684 family)